MGTGMDELVEKGVELAIEELARLGFGGSKDTRRYPDQWTPADLQPSARKGFDTSVELTPGRDLFVYTAGQGGLIWSGYSSELRANLEPRLVSAGLLRNGDFIPGQANQAINNAWDTVLDWSEYYGITPLNALRKLEREGAYKDANGGGGGGGGRSTVTTIPDYATIAQRAKEQMRNTLGRDVEDWEMKLVADEMQKQYRSASQQQLAASLAGSGEFEIADPQTVTQAYIEEQYAPEIDRVSDVAQAAGNHKLSMDVLTKGASMIGGLV
jgi:hypothetical protein